MRKIRVLIVDDSAVIRRMLSDLVSGDPSMEVAGTAANGAIALAMVPQVNPDLVTLDVEMPEVDGLQTLAGLRKTWRSLPVIMFSTLTSRGAAATLDALALGASDYCAKPSGVSGHEAAKAKIRDDLLPKIRALCAHVVKPVLRPLTSAGIPRAPVASRAVTPRVLVVGCSTGGPNALAELLPALPKDFPLPVLVVQHMPPLFTKMLADRLAQKCKLRVGEATDGVQLAQGQIWIAPGDFHMALGADGRVRLNQEPPENSCRPAVDVLFRSVVRAYGAATLGVVLTGMGQDGLRGSQEIRGAGGQVLAQDEATSVVWGMPGFVARANLADKVLPLDRIAFEILARIRHRSALEVG